MNTPTLTISSVQQEDEDEYYIVWLVTTYSMNQNLLLSNNTILFVYITIPGKI